MPSVCQHKPVRYRLKIRSCELIFRLFPFPPSLHCCPSWLDVGNLSVFLVLGWTDDRIDPGSDHLQDISPHLTRATAPNEFDLMISLGLYLFGLSWGGLTILSLGV